jgi:hypothetical protein
MRVDRSAYLATTSGNVLIGTSTDAGYKLDVNGTARVSNSTQNTAQALFTGSSSPFIQTGVCGYILVSIFHHKPHSLVTMLIHQMLEINLGQG